MVSIQYQFWLLSSNLVQTYRRAALHMVPSHGIAVIHRIESSHLIHTHRRHLQYPRHLVHDTDARKPVLPLSQIQQWHNGRLLVLARVPAEHLLDEVLILRVELEGDREVVVGSVAVDIEEAGLVACHR